MVKLELLQRLMLKLNLTRMDGKPVLVPLLELTLKQEQNSVPREVILVLVSELEEQQELVVKLQAQLIIKRNH